MLFISSSLLLYLNNQADLGYQLKVVLPFMGLFLATLTIGLLLWLNTKYRIASFLLWAYYLIGPLFLVFSSLRDIPLEFLDKAGGTFIFTTLSIAIIFTVFCFSNARRATAFFGMLSVLLVSIEIYYFVSKYEWANDNSSNITMELNNDRDVRPNIYHIIFDGFQSDIFSLILTQNLKKDLSGFTYYKENTALYDMTEWSVPSVFLGAYHDFNASREEYQNRAFNSEFSFLRELKIAGYSTFAYTRKLYPMKLKLFDKIIQHIDNVNVEKINNNDAFLGMWFYRNAPLFITRSLANKSLIMDQKEFEQFNTGTYLPNSAPVESYLSFQNILKQEKSLPSSNRYTFIHILIPHTPYAYSSTCREQESATVTSQSQCAIRLITEHLNMLKALGRFRDSMIIIHGDHGDNFMMKNGKLIPQSIRSPRTLLIIKPSEIDDTQKLIISDENTTLLDIATTLIDFVGSEPNDHQEGVSLIDKMITSRTSNKYYFSGHGRQTLKRYLIKGSLLEFQDITELKKDSIAPDLVDLESAKLFPPNRIIEAEAGQHSGATDIRSNIPNTSGKYIINGNAYFKFNIKKSGKFYLKARLITPSGNNDSSWVRIDDSPIQKWGMRISDQWKWQRTPFEWNLSTGVHLISIKYREPVYLDQIELKETAG